MLPIEEICPAKKKIEIDEKNIAVVLHGSVPDNEGSIG